jgi:hypothetical protein
MHVWLHPSLTCLCIHACTGHSRTHLPSRLHYSQRCLECKAPSLSSRRGSKTRSMRPWRRSLLVGLTCRALRAIKCVALHVHAQWPPTHSSRSLGLAGCKSIHDWTALLARGVTVGIKCGVLHDEAVAPLVARGLRRVGHCVPCMYLLEVMQHHACK